MNSMTGYGRSDASIDDGLGLVVEASSVNKKNLDVKLYLPKEFAKFEVPIRNMASCKVARGILTLRISQSWNGISDGMPALINEKALSSYSRQARRIAERLGLGGDVRIGELLALPGVLSEQTFPDDARVERKLLGAVEAALDSMLKMRSEEGAKLKEDIVGRIVSLERMLPGLEKMAASLPDEQRKNLHRRLQEAGLGLDLNDERIVRELAIFADKSDVTEELTRLRSHLSSFRDIAAREGEPVGRTLDFLSQEIHREINTLSAKATGPEISGTVIFFKAEVEKIREQLQNIE